MDGKKCNKNVILSRGNNMKKFNCPVCNKELVRLEPFVNGVYEFWCDDCNIDIVITKNDELEEED